MEVLKETEKSRRSDGLVERERLVDSFAMRPQTSVQLERISRVIWGATRVQQAPGEYDHWSSAKAAPTQHQCSRRSLSEIVGGEGRK